MLDWPVNKRGIEPHIPVFHKPDRKDGTFSRGGFDSDQETDTYVCPGGKTTSTTGTPQGKSERPTDRRTGQLTVACNRSRRAAHG